MAALLTWDNPNQTARILNDVVLTRVNVSDNRVKLVFECRLNKHQYNEVNFDIEPKHRSQKHLKQIANSIYASATHEVVGWLNLPIIDEASMLEDIHNIVDKIDANGGEAITRKTPVRW